MGFVIAYHRQAYASEILAQWGKEMEEKRAEGATKS